MLRFARIYFVFCCCLRKQTAGLSPNVGPSKQGLPRSLPYARISRTRRDAISFSSLKPGNRPLSLPPPSSSTLSMLSSRYLLAIAGNVTPKPISSEAPRVQRYCVSSTMTMIMTMTTINGAAIRFPFPPLFSQDIAARIHTCTRTSGIYQARVSSVKTFLLIGAQYLL